MFFSRIDTLKGRHILEQGESHYPRPISFGIYLNHFKKTNWMYPFELAILRFTGVYDDV